MAIAYVQHTTRFTGNASSMTTDGLITPTSGHLLVFILTARLTFGTDVTPVPSDSGGLTWTKVYENTTPANFTRYTAVWTATATGTVDQTFTLTYADGFGVTAITILDISGQAAAPFDQSEDAGTVIASTSHSSGNTGTLAQANNLLVGIANTADSPDPSPYSASGWTIRAEHSADNEGQNYAVATKVVAATTATAFAYTTGLATGGTDTEVNLSTILVFKELVAAPAGNPWHHYRQLTAA